MKQIVIIDRNFSAPSNAVEEPNIAWRNSCVNSKTIATAIELVEQNPREIRRLYLNWIFEIGVRKRRKGSIFEVLKISGDFSLWWFTTLYQRCNFFSSPYISDVIKLIALNCWLEANEIKSLVLVTDDKSLYRSIKSIANNNCIEFNYLRSPERRIGRVAPSFVKALRSFVIYRIARSIKFFSARLRNIWNLKNCVLDKNNTFHNGLVFISHFTNFDINAARNGEFHSNYWGGLPSYLSESRQILFVHLFFESELISSGKEAKQLIEEMQNKGRQNIEHVFLESFICWRVLLKTFRTWIILISSSYRFVGMSEVFRFSNIDFYSYYKRDWDNSFFDVSSLNNILYFYLFERLTLEVRPQAIASYLQENQPWEYSLVYWAKKRGWAKTIGVAHSSVRFWDLRYHMSEHELSEKNIGYRAPTPDFCAVNGALAYDSLLGSGFPAEKMKVVEALRYEHLRDVGTAGGKFSKNSGASGLTTRILVLGDYSRADTEAMLALLDKAVQRIQVPFSIIFKWHPVTLISLEQFSRLKKYKTVGSSLSDMLAEVDIVISGCLTTGAVDAVCKGIPAICVLSDSGLNLSPLIGLDSAFFVADDIHLASAIERALQMPREQKTDYFFLGEDYFGWINLFGHLEESRINK